MADVLEEQIKDKLKEMLLDINSANGYYTTIKEVYTEEASLARINQFPAVNILMGALDYADERVSEAGRLMKVRNIILDFFLFTNRDKQLKLNKLIADIEIRFFDDTVNGNTSYNMDASAFNLENVVSIVHPVSAVPFNIEKETDKFGLEFSMNAHYRQNRSDPTQLYG